MAAAAPDGPALDPRHDHPHPDAGVEEWVFTAWVPDGSLGVVSAHRATGRRAWYWSAVVRDGAPLLHVAEWDVPRRADSPDVLKAHGLWAEHHCEAPMEQWTVANECFAAALDDPDEALGRGFGTPTGLALDLEWYATRPPIALTAVEGMGFRQDGVVHGVIETAGGPLHLTEAPGRRWRRWGTALGALTLPDAYAHTGLRAPFAFPDGTVADWVLTPDGFRARATSPPAP